MSMFYAQMDGGYIALPAVDIQIAEARLYKLFGAYKKDFVIYDRIDLVDAAHRANFFGSLGDYMKMQEQQS